MRRGRDRGRGRAPRVLPTLSSGGCADLHTAPYTLNDGHEIDREREREREKREERREKREERGENRDSERIEIARDVIEYIMEARPCLGEPGL